MGKPKQTWSRRYLKNKDFNASKGLRENWEETHNLPSPDTTNNTALYEEKQPQPVFCIQPDDHLTLAAVSQSPAQKQIPLRPTPTYNTGTNLNVSDTKIPPLLGAVPHIYPSVQTVLENHPTRLESTTHFQFSPNQQQANPCWNFDVVHYVTNHLSNIEITRVHAQQQDSVTHRPSIVAPRSIGRQFEPVVSEDLVYRPPCQQIFPSAQNTQVSEKVHKISSQSKTIRRKSPIPARARRG